MGIDHCLVPIHRPQTNGMVERFNGRMLESWQPLTSKAQRTCYKL
ncbi:MAG TPA: hypothetical protein DCF45_03575 [Gammaproteobacteria bacterium]|nr:hypothetical protein [Gammaproteobacteria bacterium]